MRIGRICGGVLALALLAGTAWAALAPVSAPSRDEIFVIPHGTWARRMAGSQVEILPAEIRLTLGLKDILVLVNHDEVPQQFGPVLMMPGQSFRLPFAKAARYQFMCTAHLSGQMSVTVDPPLATPWARVWFRVRELALRLRDARPGISHA